MELIGQTLAGKYRLDELIQEGGIGQLYRATHVLMDKRVTVKVLNPALAKDEKIVERFASEAKIASRLSHPNILNVTDYGKDENGAVFLVLENLEGETLAQVLRREGVIALQRTINIAGQIAHALTAAHKVGISHLDLKSENVLLTNSADDSDWVKVFNFSVAPTNDTKGYDGDFPMPEIVAGTPHYLSPEQCFDGEVDHRSDIYSLGIIVYEMLTGKVPFDGATAQDIMLKQLEMPPPPLTEARPELPIEVEYVLSRALAKKPIQRFQSAVDFADALSRAAAPKEEETVVIPREQAVAAVAGSDAANADKKTDTSNNLWKTAFLVLAGISLLAVSLIYMTGQKSSALTTTPMASDANSNPVQPANPPTGQSEQNLSQIPDLNANSQVQQVPTGADPYPSAPMPQGIPRGIPLGQSPTSGGQIPNNIYPPNYTAPNTIVNCGSEFMPCDTTVINANVPNPNSNLANRAPNAANQNSNVNIGNSNRRPNTNSNSANTKTNNANLGGTTKPTTNNANVAQPEATPAPTPTDKPPTKPNPKVAPKTTTKPATEKPKTETEKPKAGTETTGKQEQS